MGTTSWKHDMCQLGRGWEADRAVCSCVCPPCRNCSFGNSPGLKRQWNRADQTWVSPSLQWARGGRSSVPADERDGSVRWDGCCCYWLNLLFYPNPKISKPQQQLLRAMVVLRKDLLCVWESSNSSSWEFTPLVPNKYHSGGKTF